MVLLFGLSALFSASEAALFSLTAPQRQRLVESQAVDRAIRGLLSDAPHLLTCVLLCNLAANLSFFACTNVIASWVAQWPNGQAWGIGFAFGAVSVVILFAELLPKSIGVLAPMRISRNVAIPLSWIVWGCGPIARAMHGINDICRRLIWPGVIPESVLESSDLERAIELSQTDSKVVNLEKGVLRNILQLSSIQAQEWMRPQSQFDVIAFPIPLGPELKMLDPNKTSSAPRRELVLVANAPNQEIVAVTSIHAVSQAIAQRSQPALRPVLFFPWCATLADIFQQMLQSDRHESIIVNERGDSIGVLVMDDLVEAIFEIGSSSSGAFSRPHFTRTGQSQWEVTGMTRIKQLERMIGIRLPTTRDATLSGVLQSELRRLAQSGDHIVWGPIQLQVTSVSRRGEMLIQITSQSSDVLPHEEVSGS